MLQNYLYAFILDICRVAYLQQLLCLFVNFPEKKSSILYHPWIIHSISLTLSGLLGYFSVFFYLNRLQGQRTNRNKAITLGEMHFVVVALTECIYNLLTCVYISFIILPLIALFTSVHFSSGQNAFYLVFKSVLFIKLDRCTWNVSLTNNYRKYISKYTK